MVLRMMINIPRYNARCMCIPHFFFLAGIAVAAILNFAVVSGLAPPPRFAGDLGAFVRGSRGAFARNFTVQHSRCEIQGSPSFVNFKNGSFFIVVLRWGARGTRPGSHSRAKPSMRKGLDDGITARIRARHSATSLLRAQERAGVWPLTSVASTSAPFKSSAWVASIRPLLAAT